MHYIKRFFKSMALCFGSIFILLSLYTVLLYFEVITSSFYITFIMVISVFIGSYYLGSFSRCKGYLEGLKFASMFSLISLIISLFTRPEFGLSVIVYYLIIYLTSILGSIIGINYKKTEN